MITIRDVAREAGVSISTVSKVMNDSPTISDVTKNRVKEIMKDLNYYPSAIARSFVRQSSRNVGVLMEFKRSYAFVNPYLYEILGGIEEVVQENGYFLTLSSVNSVLNNKGNLDKIIMEKRIDGLIIHMAALTRGIVRRLEELKFPFVVIGQPDFRCRICWVDINNRLAGEIAANHLLEEGCEKIGFIGGIPGDAISSNRRKGYGDVLQTRGIRMSDRYVKSGETTSEEGWRLMNELLELPDPPDGVICTDNFTAVGAMKAARAKGLRIPEDVAFISFDNHPLSQLSEPQLTVVDIDVFDLGAHAANALMKKLKDPNLQLQYNMLSPTLIVRGSTRKSP